MPSSKSVILSCAGIGSRLGLAKTKVLMEFHGKSLLAWHLQNFKDVEDLRIVVGYQAGDVIREALKYRKDITFVYNHDYFETKTGYSFYLGARHANKYVIEWDGDLIVHPDDVKLCLNEQGEYAAYSEKSSEDSILCDIDQYGNIINFSDKIGEYEWTGPCCIEKENIKNYNNNVYDILKPNLPIKGIKIRAKDIDTYQDYINAVKFMEEFICQ